MSQPFRLLATRQHNPARHPGKLALYFLGCAVLAQTLLTQSVSAQSWPSYRGPAGDGVASADLIPETETMRLELLWKQPIGSGYSGISIAEGRVVTVFSDGTSDVATAYSAERGEELWRHEIAPTYKGHDGSHDGPIATPLIADGTVFILAPRGQFVALDLASGELRWQVELAEELGAPKPHYGFSSSPLMADGKLLLQLGAEEASLAAFDPASGKKLWGAGSDGVAYQTPILTELQGQDLLLAAGRERLTAYNPGDGTVVWDHNHGGGGARGAGSLTPVTAGDGRVFLAHDDDASKMIRVNRGEDGSWATQTLWEGRDIRNSYTVAVSHQDHIYAYSSRFLTCVDSESGEVRWRSRAPGDGFITLAGDHLIILTKNGSLHLAEANREGHVEKARLELFDDLAWSAPSVADGRIFVRSLGELAAVAVRSGEAEQVADNAGLPPADTRLGQLLGEVETAIAAEQDPAPILDRLMAEAGSTPWVEPGHVHFLYRGPGDDLAVASELFGARQEKPMRRVGETDLFVLSVPMPDQARFNYMLVRDYEWGLDARNPRTISTTMLGPEMELPRGGSIAMSWAATSGWSEAAHLQPHAGAEVGTLEVHELDSSSLEGKLSYTVYLPPGYEQDAQRRYPVVYVHGSGALTRGAWKHSLDQLLGHQVEPLIAVFADPPRRKEREFDQALTSELIPIIDERYRTRAEAGQRASVGAGGNGFGAVLMALNSPNLFAKAGAQSMLLFGFHQQMLARTLEGMSEGTALDIYMDWGRWDLRNPHEAWDMTDANRKAAEDLTAKGMTLHGGEVLDTTGWKSWSQRTGDLLGSLFPMAR